MKVLIVDDMKEIREFVKRILEKKGLQCDLAETGSEALKLADMTTYDLVLLDVQLPDIDGYTVCERYKKMPQSKDVPVLFLTVLDAADNAVKGLKAGAVDYIRKPFDRDELLARVMVHLELRKTRLALQSQVADNQQLVHILCHDLSNPMASTVSLLNMLQEAPENTVELIPMVSQYLERGLELVDLIREMVAIEENKFDLNLVPVYLLECLKESQSMLGMRFDEKKIELDIDVDSDTVLAMTTVISGLIFLVLRQSMKKPVLSLDLEDPGVVRSIEKNVRKLIKGYFGEEVEA